MKLYADECCDRALVSALRQAGHDVEFALESAKGWSDSQILNRAYNEDRILVTEDKDFGELVYRLRKPSAGIILLRIPVEQRSQKAERLLSVLTSLGSKIHHHLIAIDLEKIRIRPLS